MYYVTVLKGKREIVRRKVFSDFTEAINFFSKYYQPKTERCVLSFTTEVINGDYARTFASLIKPESIVRGTQKDTEQAKRVAAKQSNSFNYDDDYTFLLESELGIREE